MLEFRGRFQWPWKKKDRYVNPDLDPVVLVPGIGGSILMAVDEKGHRERIWVRLFAADHEFKSKLWSLFDPETGRTKSLDPRTTIEVPDDRHGLYSCDILDPDLVVPLNVVCYFHQLIGKLIEWGYEEGSSLFGFGYDFRQSNRLEQVMELFKIRLESTFDASGGKKVNIVSHSMGGLLVKSFLALHHDVFEKYVNSWIAIAAPFQGAPGFVMDVLLTGCEFVKGWQRELFIAKWSMHQLLIECPSIYELMANPDFDWPRIPHLKIWCDYVDSMGQHNVKLESYGPKDLLPILTEALKNNTMTYGQKKIPLPFNHDIFNWSNETRRILETAKLPVGVKFYNLFGTDNDTPLDVCYGSETAPVRNLPDILQIEADFFCVDGDGTVPRESAMADNLQADARVGIPGDHRGMLSDPRLFRVLKQWLNAGDPDPFYDPMLDFVILPTREEWDEYFSSIACNKNEKGNSGKASFELIASLYATSDGEFTIHAEAQAVLTEAASSDCLVFLDKIS